MKPSMRAKAKAALAYSKERASHLARVGLAKYGDSLENRFPEIQKPEGALSRNDAEILRRKMVAAIKKAKRPVIFSTVRKYALAEASLKMLPKQRRKIFEKMAPELKEARKKAQQVIDARHVLAAKQLALANEHVRKRFFRMQKTLSHSARK
ncbi:MAG: hypothetical protein Q7R70_02350 [Candidatus Diapherotrites archaeon]|nr:hypothetical protein [Candidatus Diapherotrites archaeon]